MEKFLNKLNSEAEVLANAYMNSGNETTLKEIDLRLSILSHAQTLKQASLTSDLTETLKEQMKDIDVSKIDFNNLMNQFSNFNAKQ